MYLEDDDFDLVGSTTIPEDDEVTEKEETQEEVTEEAVEAEVEKEQEVPDEEPKKDNKTQALDAERARRKAAEKELKELKARLEKEETAKEDEAAFNEKKDTIRKKLLEKEVMDEEVADTILNALGDDLIKTQIQSERISKEQDFENALSELKKDDLFMDADNYKPQIKELMKKGLTMEEAYMASVGKSRFSQMKKDMEVEIEQRLLNNDEKAEKVDIGHAEEKGAIKHGKYTKREQEIARETGLSVEEVHKRSTMFSIEDLENL